MRECGKAVGPLGDLLGKSVVEFLRERDRLLAVELIGAGRDVHAGLRQHLHGDAVTIHVGEPAVADVGHLVGGVGDDTGHIAGNGWRGGILDTRHDETEMFFKRDDAHRDSQAALALRGSMV